MTDRTQSKNEKQRNDTGNPMGDNTGIARIGRWEYFLYSIFYFVIFGILAFILGFTQAAFDSYILHLISLPLVLAFAYIFLRLSIKRLHDFGYTGYWVVILALPYLIFAGTPIEFILELLLWLILLVIPGNKKRNQFGEVPKKVTIKDIWRNPLMRKKNSSNSKQDQSDWPVVVAIVVIFLGFYFGGLWIGLVVSLISLSALGWKDRHKGPFPTNKAKQE